MSASLCHRCQRPATVEIGGVMSCDDCARIQPRFLKPRKVHAWLSAWICVAVMSSGCRWFSRPAPDNPPIAETTEMGRYFASSKACIHEALADTLKDLGEKQLDEQGYRAACGKYLQAANRAASEELRQGDAAIAQDGWTAEKAASLLQRRIEESK